MTIQIPSLILPTVWFTGLETENVNNLVEHTSLEIPVQYLENKTIHIMAIEFVTAFAPGPLNCWVEVSPVPSTISTLYWAAIGGGGGMLPPTAPTVIAGTGVNGATHTFVIPWAIHSVYARLVVQTPINAGLPVDFWIVQALIQGSAL